VSTLAAGEGVRGLEGAERPLLRASRALASGFAAAAAAAAAGSFAPGSPPLLLLLLIICSVRMRWHPQKAELDMAAGARRRELQANSACEGHQQHTQTQGSVGSRRHLAHDVLPDVAQLELRERLFEDVRRAQLDAAPDVVRAAALLAHEHQRQVRRALAQAAAVCGFP
jgi:hypothetical protein